MTPTWEETTLVGRLDADPVFDDTTEPIDDCADAVIVEDDDQEST